jgi:lysophospholipase L1-like esterase
MQAGHMYSNSGLKIVRDTFSVARVISRHRGIHHGVWYLVSFRTKGLYRFLLDGCSVVYARVLGKPLIHVIGDSHGKIFRGHRPFIVHHLGAATAHNLVKENSITKSNKKLSSIIKRINRKDVVLLVFGEIDCRIHIYYQYKKNGERKGVSELIDETISNYGAVLEKLRGLGIRTIVCGVPPATKVRNEYRYPFYAPPEVHCQINRDFNAKLREFCSNNGFHYIDIHSRFSDDDGFMLKEYAADEIHLNRKATSFMKGEINHKLGPKI